jgi:hypothetical protein
MTQYLDRTFTVSQRGRDPATCDHGWLAAIRGKLTCVQCGLPWPEIWMREQEDAALTAELAKREGP